MSEAPILNTPDSNAVLLASLHQQIRDILQDVQSLDSPSVELCSSGTRLQRCREALRESNSELRRSLEALEASSYQLEDRLDRMTAVRQPCIVEVISYSGGHDQLITTPDLLGVAAKYS